MAGSFLLQPAKYKKVYFKDYGDCYFPPLSQAIVNGRGTKENQKTYFVNNLKTSFLPN